MLVLLAPRTPNTSFLSFLWPLYTTLLLLLLLLPCSPPTLHSPVLFVSVFGDIVMQKEGERSSTKQLLLNPRHHPLSHRPYNPVFRFTHFILSLVFGKRSTSHPRTFLTIKPFSSFPAPLPLHPHQLPQPLINFSFLPFISFQPPVVALHSLHLIFLLPTLSISSSTNFLQFYPLLFFLSNPSFCFSFFFPERIWAKCLMGCNKWAKEWAVVRWCTFMQTPNTNSPDCFILSFLWLYRHFKNHTSCCHLSCPMQSSRGKQAVVL